MVVFTAIFFLVLYFSSIFGYVLIGDEEHEIVWPSEYHFKCDKLDFETTVKQSTEVWYSAERNRSRISYNDGSTQKYYYGDKDRLYMLDPRIKSREEMTSEILCTMKWYRAGQADFMPDVGGLTYSGLTMEVFGKVVNVWKSEEQEQGKAVETTLYISKDDDGYDVPVQKIVKKYLKERGELSSHVVYNYYNYDNSITEKDVTLDKAESRCFYGGELGADFKTDIKMLHPDEPNDVDIAFDSYIGHHNKAYIENEKELRKSIFEKNWRMVHEYNQRDLGFKLEINKLSDRTYEELKYLRGTFVPKHEVTGALPFPLTQAELEEIEEELPEHLDLRMDGAVTAVKDQGECGSCWAFASTAAMEGALTKINGDRLLDLSEQSLVDCGWKFDNLGCAGGMLDGAMKYIQEIGIPTEREYGLYMEQDGICKIRNMTTSYKSKGFVHVTPRNPIALKTALYKYGPVVVTIYSSDLMMHYHSGVFYDFTCEDEYVNHAVTVVGYGVYDGEEYWLVKNSYGEKWGQGGYVLFSARNNNCLLLDTAYYHVV